MAQNMTRDDYENFVDDVSNSIDLARADIAKILLVELTPLEKLSAAIHAFECLDNIYDVSIQVKDDVYRVL